MSTPAGPDPLSALTLYDMFQQVDLVKRRTVDYCRATTCLCMC